MQHAPPAGTVSIAVKIRAGSAAEREFSGSGISHFVEHMVFKGTAKRKSGAVEEEIKSYGGLINGSAGADFTTFTLTVPTSRLNQALELLADILTNATFDPAELEKERAVIEKEIALTNDDPERRVARIFYEDAYRIHPYRYPAIGYADRLAALDRADLTRYYERMYVPNRMVVAIIGDVDVDAVSARAATIFRALRRASYDTAGDNAIIEPSGMMPREREEERPVALAYEMIGYRSVAITDADLYALDVLSMILGRGETSRLTRIVQRQKKLVHSVAAWNHTPVDPGVFTISFVADPDKADEAQRSILAEIERIKDGEIEDEEIAGARRMVIADFMFSRQTHEAQADDTAMGELLTGDYRFSERYVDGIAAVSKSDIQRVARRYLSDRGRTRARLIPLREKAAVAPQPPAPAADEIHKTVLDNGLTILVRENKLLPVVSLSMAIRGGLLAETPQTNGISYLTAQMLLKGTARRSEDQIAGAIERRGGTIETFSGFNGLGITVSVLADDLDLALAVINDVVTAPTFPADKLEDEKMRTIALASEEDLDIFARGGNAARKELFGTHPYAMRYLGEPSSIAALGQSDLAGFFANHATPGSMVLSISGDVDRDAVIAKVAKLFGGIAGRASAWPDAEIPALSTVIRSTLHLDKEEALVLFAFKTTSLADHDRYALDLLGSLLSGSSGRLFHELRNKRSLAYTLGCAQKLAIDTGYFLVYAATAPKDVAETRAALMRELAVIRRTAPGAAELDKAKRELTTEALVRMQTNEFFSLQSALDELYGIGYAALYRYAAEIDAVTADDVQRVAATYLTLDRFVDLTITP